MNRKSDYHHLRGSMDAGTEDEWKKLLKLCNQRSVKGVLNSMDDEYQDVHRLLQRKLKEKPLKLPLPKKEKFQTWLILGCIHRPFHNKVLWKKILLLIQELSSQLSGVVINGDYLDMGAVSDYGVGKKGSSFTLMDEYEDGLEGLLEIEAALGKNKSKVKKYFLFGNHEHRWFRHISKLEISKYGNALLNPVDALRLDELGYQVITDYQNGYLQIGKDLQVFHGHYHNVHAAKKHLDALDGFSCIFNHTHRFQSYSSGNHTAYNIGCLIDLKNKAFNYSDRFKKDKWKNGFAIVNVTRKGKSIVNPIECFNDSFYFGNRLY